MKKGIVLSFFVCSGIGLFAQEIDISKFTLPEYKRSELEFNLSSENSGSFTKNKYENGTFSSKIPGLSTNSLADVTLRRYSNNAHYQGFLKSNFNFSLPVLSKTWDKSDISETDYFNRQNSLNLGFSSDNRFYGNSKWYYEVNPSVYVLTNGGRTLTEYLFDDSASNYHTNYENSHFATGLSSGFRIGKGRVEPVEDMRQVVYILQDLKKAGRLKRELTQEETLILAEKLSLLKNRRFLDARLRLIEETAEIERIMTEMDLIAENDALFFSTVNDYWSKAANPSRSSGSRLSVGARPGIGFSKDLYMSTDRYYDPDTIISTETRSQDKLYGVDISARYEQFKPINLYWQQDYYFDVSANLSRRNTESLTDNASSERDLIYGLLSAEYTLKYYPDSRTTYYGGAAASFQLWKLNEKSTSIDRKDNDKIFSTRIFFAADHYFSPQLTLNGSVGVNYSNSDFSHVRNTISSFDKGNNVSLSLSVGLYYKLF